MGTALCKGGTPSLSAEPSVLRPAVVDLLRGPGQILLFSGP